MKVLAGIIIIIIGIVVYFKLSYPEYTYRYRLTVEINTPEGIKSGSSVIEIRTEQWPRWMSVASSQSKTAHANGEAPFIDLGERGILFTTLSYDFIGKVYSEIFTGKRYDSFQVPKTRAVPEYATAMDFKANIPSSPYFVMFKDLNNPMSVVEVNPENMAEIFGEGVKLKAFRLESTKDELEKKIDKILPWLSEYYVNQLDGRRYNTIEAENKLANSLSAGSFSFHKKKKKQRKNR